MWHWLLLAAKFSSEVVNEILDQIKKKTSALPKKCFWCDLAMEKLGRNIWDAYSGAYSSSMHQSIDLIYLSRKKEILLNNHLINLLAFALLDLRLLTEILTQAREVKDEGVELDECKIIRQDFLLPS